MFRYAVMDDVHTVEPGLQGHWRALQEEQEGALLGSEGCPGRQMQRWRQGCLVGRVVGVVPGLNRLHLQSGQCDVVEEKQRGLPCQMGP